MIPKVGTGFRKRSCSNNKLERDDDSKKSHPALAVAFPKGGLAGVRHRDPCRVGRGVGDVSVVPVPPLVGSALGVALRRVLPRLLTPERRHVAVAPDGPHRLVAAAVDEIGAKDALAVADERVVAVPFI